MAFDWGQSFLGVAMALLSITLSSVGFVLQRRAHMDKLESGRGLTSEPVAAVAAQGSLVARLRRTVVTLARKNLAMPRHQRLQILGIVVYILAALPDALAWTLLPQVVCSTVESFRLVIMLVLARVFLRESLLLRDLPWVTGCMLGTVLCIWYGPYRGEDGEEQHTVVSTKVSAYLVIGLCLVLLLVLLEHSRAETCPKAHRVRHLTLPFNISLTFALEKVLNTELGVSIAHKPTSGVVVSAWQMKIWWASITVAIDALALLNFYLTVRCARLLPVRVSAPLGFAFGTCLQLFQSIAILDEFRTMDLFRKAMVLLGTCLSFLSAFCLEMSRIAREEVHDDSSYHQETFEMSSGDATTVHTQRPQMRR